MAMGPVACGQADGAGTLARARSRNKSAKGSIRISAHEDTKSNATHNTLDTVEVVLDLGGLADQPPKRLLDGDDVREDDAGLRGRDVEARADGEDGDDEGEEDAKEVEADT